jgi:UDPglucose 6-dehydrogenase
MKLAVIGAGYVGLTTAACLAELGQTVVCADIDAGRIGRLERGDVPIHEPGLGELIAANTSRGRLGFSCRPELAAADCQAVFIAVGTPAAANGDIDLSFVETAARQIAHALAPNAVVVVKSTVSSGTCRHLREIIAEHRGALDFAVASNPEFLREGSAIEDFFHPDRVVIGTDDAHASDLLQQIYAPLLQRGVPIVSTTPANAELIKYAANAFLALKIGFINDVANLCEAVGGDVTAIAEGIGLDRRIGRAFLGAGPGFGGSCFPKDTRGFAAAGRRADAPQPLIETLIAANERRKRAMAARLLRELPRTAPRVTLLGLSFKGGTADLREALSLDLIPQLLDAKVDVRVHDPLVGSEILRRFPGIDSFDSLYVAATEAEVVAILTDCDDYRRLDLARLRRAMAGRTIVDFRNLLDPAEVGRHGFRYVSIGRPALDTEERRVRAPLRQPATRANPGLTLISTNQAEERQL